jgi:hypothetical protein
MEGVRRIGSGRVGARDAMLISYHVALRPFTHRVVVAVGSVHVLSVHTHADA